MPSYTEDYGGYPYRVGGSSSQSYSRQQQYGSGPSTDNGSCPGCSSSNNNSPFSSNSFTNMNNSIQSWYDTSRQEPFDPRMLIVNARLGATQGDFIRSTNFIGGATWIASPFALTGAVTCTSLDVTDAMTVASANQWNFSHKGANVSATNPVPLRKVVYLRGGPGWEMQMDIDLGAGTYTDLQISFRDNAATPGNFAGSGSGTIPAIRFNASKTGIQDLHVSLKMYGTFVMAISARDALSNWSLFEMEWVIVP